MALIAKETIAQVFERARIEEVVGEFVSLKRAGSNLKGLCPFHNEKTPSFVVSPQKNTCHCFGCHKGGGPVNFLMEHENMTYPEAITYLAKKYGIEVVYSGGNLDEEKEKISQQQAMFNANEYAEGVFQDNLWNTPAGRSIGLSYFRERGFSDDIIRKFGLGYSLDDYHAFSKEALAKGYSKEILLANGLVAQNDQQKIYDRFRGRVMFPVYTQSGKVVAFGGRTLKKDKEVAKYVNSPESLIYNKSKELYGLFQSSQTIRRLKTCYLVEGYADVISMFQAGVTNVVASSGTALTHEQVMRVVRMVGAEDGLVVMLYDGDSAGIHASLRGMDMLLETGVDVKVVVLPEGEDPDSYAQNHDAAELIAYLEGQRSDAIEFKINQLIKEHPLTDPRSKRFLIGEVAQSVKLLPDPILRSEYVKKVAKILDTEEQTLLKYVEEERKKYIEAQKKTTVQTPSQAVSQTAPQPAVQTVEISHQESAVTSVTSRKSPVYQSECNLLATLIRYGNETIYFELNPDIGLLTPSWSAAVMKGNNELISCTGFEYIIQCLNDNDLQFTDEHNQHIFNEILEHSEDISSYFMNHPDLETQRYINRILGDYLVEDEQEANHELKCAKVIYRVFFEYQYAIIEEKIEQLKDKMATSDEEAVKLDAMANIQTLKNLQKQISKLLGGRSYIASNK
ncbi:MAG: DNA primase [Paludibacteraceae bacterium]|nr:DNA primase [Paludibacteraceae bacterium]